MQRESMRNPEATDWNPAMYCRKQEHPPGLAPILGLVLCLTAGWSASAQAPSREYQLKAAYLINFAQFVEWPAAAFASAEAPLVITVLGDSPFGNVLEQLGRSKRIQGRAVVVRHAESIEGIGATHLLFVAAPHDRNSSMVIKALSGKSILTVSDAEGFNRVGGCIRFFLEENKVRFEINPAAAGRTGLKTSSKLLQLARVFKED